MKKIAFLVLLFVVTGIQANAQTTGRTQKITVSKLERKLKDSIQLVDVRTKKEFDEQHLAHAQNIDIDASDFDDKIQHLDKNKPVYVYCRSGRRSDKAAQKMLKLGFTKVYDLQGGIIAWNEKKAKQ